MDFEPKIIDYYNEIPECYKTIENLNNEYNELQDENSRLIKELTFLESAFKYPHNNSVIFNLVRVKKNGEDTWIDKIKISEFELNKLDQCETVKYLLQNCNPKCER